MFDRISTISAVIICFIFILVFFLSFTDANVESIFNWSGRWITDCITMITDSVRWYFMNKIKEIYGF